MLLRATCLRAHRSGVDCHAAVGRHCASVGRAPEHMHGARNAAGATLLPRTEWLLAPDAPRLGAAPAPGNALSTIPYASPSPI
jgi:hypothetical protein